jgi:hypothetical protein
LVKVIAIISVAILLTVLTMGRESALHNRMQPAVNSITISGVGYPQTAQKFLSRRASEVAQMYTPKPGGADLAALINIYRQGVYPPLRFTISATKNSAGFPNPLMTAVMKRNSDWGSPDNPPAATGFVSVPTSLTAAAVTSAFSTASITPPSSYKEYNFYGEWCADPLFLIMKNGPSSSSSPGYGINNDVTSTQWTNVAIAAGQNYRDSIVPNTNGLGNGYWTVIFSTSFDWYPATRKPTMSPNGNPSPIATTQQSPRPTPYPVATTVTTPKPNAVPTRYPVVAAQPTLKPIPKPTPFPVVAAQPTLKPIPKPTPYPIATNAATPKPNAVPTGGTPKPVVRPSKLPNRITYPPKL